MAYEIKRALEKLKQEMLKDKEQVERHKQKTIEEIKTYDRSKMFNESLVEKKKTFFQKLLIILGNGKKR